MAANSKNRGSMPSQVCSCRPSRLAQETSFATVAKTLVAGPALASRRRYYSARLFPSKVHFQICVKQCFPRGI
jgi:hypothetical protein